MRPRSWTALATLAVAASLALPACGGGSNAGDPVSTSTIATTTTGPTDPTVVEVKPPVDAQGQTTDVSVSTPDGRTRTAHLYVPATLPSGAVPLLVALHGGGGSGTQFQETSRYDRIAEANGFLVAYPDGLGGGPQGTTLRTWNGGVCCGAAVRDGVDDVAFLRQLVTQLSEAHDIDPDRVFASGHSNGMIMSFRLVCEAADVFVAAAGQAGTLGIDGCAPSTAISLLDIHGDADASLPIDGGTGDGLSGVDFPSPRASVRSLAEVEGCDAEPRVSSNGPLTSETWGGCDGGGEIAFKTLAGASHAWMGSVAVVRPGAPEPFADYDASLASWFFLANHARRS